MRGGFAAPRMYKVLGIQQIAIGNESKQELRSLWCDVFGVLFASQLLWFYWVCELFAGLRIRDSKIREREREREREG